MTSEGHYWNLLRAWRAFTADDADVPRSRVCLDMHLLTLARLCAGYPLAAQLALAMMAGDWVAGHALADAAQETTGAEDAGAYLARGLGRSGH
jgi:hypothetical protein